MTELPEFHLNRIASLRVRMLRTIGNRLEEIDQLKEVLRHGVMPTQDDRIERAVSALREVATLMRSVETLLGEALDDHHAHTASQPDELSTPPS